MQTSSHGPYDPSRSRHLPSRLGFSAIDLQSLSNKHSDDYNVHTENDADEDKSDYNNTDIGDFPDSLTQSPPTLLEDQFDDVQDDTYAAMTDAPSARNAIAATYRGYCSELFVFNTCHRQLPGSVKKRPIMRHQH